MKHLIRVAGVGIAVCATVLAAASMVSAHAEYDHSTPGDGETVATSPAKVTVVFMEEIQVLPGSYGVAVTNASGASVTTGAASVGSDKMSVSIALQPALPAGAYTVNWNNTSADDGDPLDGTFTFYVGAAPTGMPTAMPMEMPAAGGHTHTDMPMAGDMTTAAAPPTTGLISVAVAAANDSGVTGRIDIFPVDGGTRTRIDAILSGLAPGSTHVDHVHASATCFEGSHVADLNPVVANDAGIGSASTVINVPFSVIANGNSNVLFHANGTADNPGIPIACGVIPAQPAAAGGGHHDDGTTGTIALPNTGSGANTAAGDVRSPLAALVLLVVAGSLLGAGSIAIRARRIS